MSHVISLLTDFGLFDAYVGQMKSVLLQTVPDCVFIDLSHNIQAHNLLQGSFFLAASWKYLPSGSICLAIVDPGVGTDREIVLLYQEDKFVLAPDNGLLTLLLSLSETNRIWKITNLDEFKYASYTFHGRDIFAPLAAQLIQGKSPWQFGNVVDPKEIVQLPEIKPQILEEKLQTKILHIDHFGNCVLNLKSETWTEKILKNKGFHLLHPCESFVFPVKTYAQIPKNSIGILNGSQGYLELALNQASCAENLQVTIGDECIFAIDSSVA